MELPDLHVQLLGRPRIICERTKAEVVLHSRTLLVLVMLLLSKCEVLSRDDIAFTLWPDEAEGEARASLRRQIYRLQNALPNCIRPFLVCDAKTASWRNDPGTYVDACEFIRLSDSADSLAAASRIYIGEFLPRVDHEWVAIIREKLHRRACHVLKRLVAECRLRGERYEAIEYVEKLHTLDPWREDALRDLMTLRFEVGDRAGAIAYYRAFLERLRGEFQVDPMPETVKCFNMIAHGHA